MTSTAPTDVAHRGSPYVRSGGDASTTGLRVALVADACAAGRDRDHNATLHVVHRSYGDVRPTDEVLGLLSAGAPGGTAPPQP